MANVETSSRTVELLTEHWGEWESVSLYLDRCQVDTPARLVEATWAHVSAARSGIGKVVDFGAGDGRFAAFGNYESYTGYEIDTERFVDVSLPTNARLLSRCAFSEHIEDADLCIGNPPFVRNQDLPCGWRQHASEVLERRTGIKISGLANAWQYFFLLSLVSAARDGLVALVIPYEWVSRPSVETLRQFIRDSKWSVQVYRLDDETFDSVLTTSSITIVDKSDRSGSWSFFVEGANGRYKPLASPTGSILGVAPYLRRTGRTENSPWATRGLSPGTQKILTLTERERARLGLHEGRDVVPCVTSLRTVPEDVELLDEAVFRSYFRDAGRKCWLIRTDRDPSEALSDYLDSVPPHDRATKTCLERDEWWKFKFPAPPQIIVSQSFRGRFPKFVQNSIRARAVGGIAGVIGLEEEQISKVTDHFGRLDVSDRVVAHSNGLRKMEINQLNGLLADWYGGSTAIGRH